MNNRFIKNIFHFVALATAFSQSVQAEAPAGYYQSCIGKCGSDLLSALHDVIGPHTAISYSGLWTVYKDSDVYPEDGKIWDMYSTKHWTYRTEQCGNVGSVLGVCYNREHSLPKSWFNDASPMVSDAFHIYPTDGKVNGVRSNLPFGECDNGSIAVPDYNGLHALGKKGSSTYPGYSGTVFEPDDMYKGDFARTYFYMATCYNDRIQSWSSDMLNGTSYPAFSSWAQNMLLEWHRKDLVSKKETDRNDAVYSYQKNRNPFIDHPELAEHIWGNKKNIPWQGSEVSDPTLMLPPDGSTIDLGKAGKSVTKSITIAVKGSAITSDPVISLTGEGFSADKQTLSANTVNSEAGAPLTINFKSATTGEHTGTLHIKSGNTSSTVYLSVSVTDGIPLYEASAISETGFVVKWTYVGGDSNGFYTLNVSTADNNTSISGYPKQVNARAELAAVNGLEPDTEYAYAISSTSTHSVTLKVRTAKPQPSVTFYSEEDFAFVTAPGEISDPQEIGVEILNISTDVNIAVSEPFEISTDKTNWSQSIDISPEADRFYMRFAPTAAGTFTTSLRATAGTYYNDDAEVTGTATPITNYLEDFEAAEENSSYATGTITGTMGEWLIESCGVIGSTSGLYIRMAKSGKSSSITMNHDKPAGIGTVKVEAAAWATNEAGSIRVDYSTDGGITWTEAGKVNVTSTSPADYTFTVNRADATRIRIVRTEGGRHKIDNIAISDYRTSGIAGVESDYSSWDAYCLNGKLVIQSTSPVARTARVYGTDGIMHASISICDSTTELPLSAGLYIVAVDDFTRRVVVR